MLGDIAGIGPVRDALTTTNTLLEQVLVELRRTNGEQLAVVAEELRAVRERLDTLDELHAVRARLDALAEGGARIEAGPGV